MTHQYSKFQQANFDGGMSSIPTVKLEVIEKVVGFTNNMIEKQTGENKANAEQFLAQFKNGEEMTYDNAQLFAKIQNFLSKKGEI